MGQRPPHRPAPPGPAPVRAPTRHLTRGPQDWPEPKRPVQTDVESEDDYEYEAVTGEFAGIPISEFVWARQHNRRMVLVWVAVILAITGLVATAAWTVGSNLDGLL
ncbi:hypothetical protein A5622_03850 [Mycobacterium sp. 1245801.1]|nr:hypothetical protein A5622_03850 [Mycobacterium sp. 1245801.1]